MPLSKMEGSKQSISSNLSICAAEIPSIGDATPNTSTAFSANLSFAPSVSSHKRRRAEAKSDNLAHKKTKLLKKILPIASLASSPLQMLNIDCFIEILTQKCINIEDLIEAASTCQFFLSVAKKVFTIKFLKNGHMEELYKMPLYMFARYFQYFGEYIELFSLRNFVFTKWNRDIVLRLVAKYCKNLTGLRCRRWRNMDISVVNKIYPQLTYFDWQGDLDGLEIFDERLPVRELRIYSSSLELPQRRFSNLLYLDLLYVTIAPKNLIGFLKLNPQLVGLDLTNTPRTWNDDETHNLEEGILPLIELSEFSFWHFKDLFTSHACFERLTKLKKLKISVPHTKSYMINNIGKAVQRANAPLESIWLESRGLEENRYDVIDTICQLKTLKKVILGDSITSGQLVEVMDNLPNLKHIDCEFAKLHFDASDISKALERANGLEALVIGMKHVKHKYVDIEAISTIAREQKIRVEFILLSDRTRTRENKLENKHFIAEALREKNYHQRQFEFWETDVKRQFIYITDKFKIRSKSIHAVPSA